MKIPVVCESFDEIRRDKKYYVDKTELIYELLSSTGNKVTVFIRPRRFGKTMMLSMMESFFSIQKGNCRDLFDGLNIMRHEAFCAEWMNQYPVLSLTLKGIEGLSFEEAYEILQVKLSEICITHLELLKSPNVAETDKNTFSRLMEKKADIAKIKDSLKTIMRMMASVYEKPVILLIDEYDIPLTKASEQNTDENQFYAKMSNVIWGMFDAAMKGNRYLKFAVVTGCLRITKESIFTETNNFTFYSVLDNKFSRYFGFTQDEVNRMLAEGNLESKAGAIRSWYDGYLIGNTPVYCPWDVANYLSALLEDPTAKPKNYWSNTSHNRILRIFLERTDFDVSDKFEMLMNGGTIRQKISDELTYDTLHETEEHLWGMLLMRGYLTKTTPDAENETVDLKIPNMEISNTFKETVVAYFRDSLASDRSKQMALMKALWTGDEETASRVMTDILFETISYDDYHENYYHAFLTEITSGLEYVVKSNQENGLGRSCIDARDKYEKRGMILEAKKSDKEEDMEKDALEGKQQIIEKEYLRGFTGYDSVICYGISFFQKKALVRKLTF